MATTMAMGASGAYPIRLEVQYAERLSRWLIFVKWLLAIPHFIIIYALELAFRLLSLMAFFAILFTGSYPKGLFKFNVGVVRWQQNVAAYISLLRDEYPPFSFDAGLYPVEFEVDYPTNLNRWMVLVKWLLAIPHYVAILLLTLASVVVLIIAWFAILFTGKYPESLFSFVVGVMRWQRRVWLYVLFMTDEYPPFSLEA